MGRISNTDMYSLAQHKEKIMSDIQDFLNYKRTNSIDFGTRLLDDFKVVNFRTDNGDSLFVEFEGYEKIPHSNHYWVQKKELQDFLAGNNRMGVNLFVDNAFVENNCTIFEVNLIKNGFKKMTIHDAQKLKGIQINYNNKLYKSYDVQVKLIKDTEIDKVIRVFVIEPTSAEYFLNHNTVVKNSIIQIKNGITFEDENSKETFVKKEIALEAVKLERKSVTNEFKAWFMLNMADKVDGHVSDAVLQKLKEIV